MGATLPTRDVAELSAVKQPTLVIAADDDVVDLRHVVSMYEALPDAQLAVVPNTSHLMHFEAPDVLCELIRRFLAGGQSARIMPMRR